MESALVYVALSRHPASRPKSPHELAFTIGACRSYIVSDTKVIHVSTQCAHFERYTYTASNLRMPWSWSRLKTTITPSTRQYHLSDEYAPWTATGEGGRCYYVQTPAKMDAKATTVLASAPTMDHFDMFAESLDEVFIKVSIAQLSLAITDIITMASVHSHATACCGVTYCTNQQPLSP